MSRARIVETTIRDGSYEVGFQYTLHDLAVLATLLDRAGFSYIEVGHGRGLAGHLRGNAPPLSDAEHLRAARAAVTHAKLGAIICFTGREEEAARLVGLAEECGLDFLRLGMSPRMFPTPIVQEVLRLAARSSMTVSVNFMRSYSVPPDELARLAGIAIDEGADWIYVVDSAGCMLPDEAEQYVRTIAARVNVPIGFHGHNNLSLAIANSLAAIKGGATLVDSTLQGLGRATGNAPTEVMAVLMKERLGGEPELDLPLLGALGRNYVRRFVSPGFDPTDVLAGAARIHSGSLGSLRTHSAAAGVHPDKVLLAVGAKAASIGALERKDLPAEIITEAAGELCRPIHDPSSTFAQLAGRLATSVRVPQTLDELLRDLQVHALRDKLSTAVIFLSERWSIADHPWVTRRGEWAFGILPVSSEPALEALLAFEAPPWLRRVFLDESVTAARVAEKTSARTTTFSAVELLATAVTSGLQRRSLVLAVDDECFRNEIERRVPGGCQKLEPLMSSEIVSSGHARWIVQGKATAGLLRRARPLLASSDLEIIVVGPTGIPPGDLAVDHGRGLIATPDLPSLLQVWPSMLLNLNELDGQDLPVEVLTRLYERQLGAMFS